MRNLNRPLVLAALSTTLVIGSLVMISRPISAQVSGGVPAYVKLQAATPGTPQTGHANITGTSIASKFLASSDGLPNNFSIEARSVSNTYGHPSIGASEGNGWAYLLCSGENVFGHSFIWNRGAPMRFGAEIVLGQAGYQEFMRFNSNGFVGINNANPTSNLSVGGSISNTGSASFVGNLVTMGTNAGDGLVEVSRPDGVPIAAITGSGNDPAGGSIGVIQIGGNLFKAGCFLRSSDNKGILFGDIKNFVEPSRSDITKDYWYASLEGPEAAMYVRGRGTLVNGRATITLPRHFVEMMVQDSDTVILTPRSAVSNGLAGGEVSNGQFDVAELGQGHGNYRFDWEVKAVRKGYENYQVEREWTARPAASTNKAQLWKDRLADLQQRNITFAPSP